MAANHDQGALEDLEAMLDRSLKIKASPPRWQPTYHITPGQAPQPAQGPYSPRTPPRSAAHRSPAQHAAHGSAQRTANPAAHHAAPGSAHSASSTVSPVHSKFASRIDSPTRAFPARVPVPGQYSASPPQAVYHAPLSRVETQAVPNPTATLGMRPSTSQQSISSVASADQWEQRQQAAVAEAQRQQQIIKQQQMEQQRLEQQRLERLAVLREQQLEQERELEMLRRRESQARQQQQPEPQFPPYQQYSSLNRSPPMANPNLHADRFENQSHPVDAAPQWSSPGDARKDAGRHEATRKEVPSPRYDSEQQEAARQEALRQKIEEEENRKQRELLERQEEASRLEAAHMHKLKLEAERARESRLEREGAVTGAATMVQRTQDSHGNVTTRVVKKGVEDFDFKEELGTGSYSTVVAAQDKQTLRQYAIKVLDKAHIIKEQKVKYVEIEKHTLNRLGDHPGIIRLYFTFQDRQSLYFVLDFAPNGELLHLIKRIGSLNEDCARYYACQLLDAIEYMHLKGVIHRDLKPENILLDYKLRIKITDFGTAKLLEKNPQTGEYPTDTRANSFVGTAEYVSPELLVGKSQGKSADVWAWGCVLYQMIAAVPPFQGNTQYLTFQKIARLQYSIPPGFPYVVRDLLKHVLVKTQQRWSVEEIKEHEFFANQDWSRKALWSSPPPRLQPYKASVASMKPRALGGRQPPKVVKPASSRPPSAAASSNTNSAPKRVAAAQPQQQQVFVPTAAGLQAVNPSTLYGMPVSINKSNDQLPSRPNSSNSSASYRVASSNGKRVGSQSANAASAALYKAPPAPSSAYQQSQERIMALKRRMQEQRQSGRNGSSYAAAAVPRPTTPSSPSVTAISTSDTSSPSSEVTRTVSPSPPMSPQLPLLPQPPLTQVESQYSNFLVSAQERILQLGHMSLLVSTHPPPQAQISSSSSKSHHSHHNSQSNASSSRHTRGSESVDSGKKKEDEVDVAFSYDDSSLFSKMFLTKNKSRLVMVTTCGRMLIMADDRKVLYEVPLGVPQTEVAEVPFQVGDRRTTKIVIQTYNKVLTLDDPGRISDWMNSIELSKRYYAQLTADQERNAFNAAAAAASAVAGRRR